MVDDDSGFEALAPRCQADGMLMSATIVGWRCPICGIAQVPRAA